MRDGRIEPRGIPAQALNLSNSKVARSHKLARRKVVPRRFRWNAEGDFFPPEELCALSVSAREFFSFVVR
jgi:hypothetical protein